MMLIIKYGCCTHDLLSSNTKRKKKLYIYIYIFCRNIAITAYLCQPVSRLHCVLIWMNQDVTSITFSQPPPFMGFLAKIKPTFAPFFCWLQSNSSFPFSKIRKQKQLISRCYPPYYLTFSIAPPSILFHFVWKL